jgi:hypothetical protein
MPGLLVMLLGVLGYAIAFPRLSFGGVTFDVHTLLFASLALICGYQSAVFAVLTKVFAVAEGLLPPDERIARLTKVASLEKCLVGAALVMLVGLGLLAGAVLQWRAVGFGPLDYGYTMRWVIPGVTLTALGFQTILSSFYMSVLTLSRR